MSSKGVSSVQNGLFPPFAPSAPTVRQVLPGHGPVRQGLRRRGRGCHLRPGLPCWPAFLSCLSGGVEPSPSHLGKPHITPDGTWRSLVTIPSSAFGRAAERGSTTGLSRGNLRRGFLLNGTPPPPPQDPGRGGGSSSDLSWFCRYFPVLSTNQHILLCFLLEFPPYWSYQQYQIFLSADPHIYTFSGKPGVDLMMNSEDKNGWEATIPSLLLPPVL